MKTIRLFRIAGPVVLIFAGWSSAGAAGQVNGAASASAGAGVQHPSAGGAANANGAVGVNGSGVNAAGAASGAAPVPTAQMEAELSNKVDSKTAKAGDAVEAKTTKTITMADGTVIPKGSKLMGTVTSVQAQEKGQDEARLGMSFDRVRLRGGQEVMVRSSIDNLSSPVGVSADNDMAVDDMIGAGPVGVRGGGAVGGRGGPGASGLVGGVGGSATSAVGRTGSALGSTTQSTVQGTNAVARGTTQAVGSTASGLVAGAAEASSGVTAHATNVPGVMLSGAASEGTSGVLSATGKNVRLESGTQMMLSVAAQR